MLVVGVLVALVLAALHCFMNHVFGDMCGNRVIRSAPSPDGAVKAVVFERNCGATTGVSEHVSVLGAGEGLPNDSGNAFIADDDRGSALRVTGAWEGTRRLVVRHRPRAARVRVRLGLFRSDEVAVRCRR